MTKQNGVDMWPNAAIWMRDELRSKVRNFDRTLRRDIIFLHLLDNENRYLTFF